MKIFITVFIMCLYLTNVSAQEIKTIFINDTLTVEAKLVYSEDFSNNLLKWIPQFEEDKSSIQIKNGIRPLHKVN